MIHMKDLKPVSRSERVLFHCQKCGGCCRYVKDGVMLEPMDAYNLARHLRDQGDSVTGTDDVLARFAHAAWLDDSLPIFLLNTFGPSDACVFLKEGQCSVYEARPRVCRLYPFTVAPGSRGRDFNISFARKRTTIFLTGL